MSRRGLVLKCGKCHTEYDLGRATSASTNDEVKCPHCGHVVGKKN